MLYCIPECKDLFTFNLNLCVHHARSNPTPPAFQTTVEQRTHTTILLMFVVVLVVQHLLEHYDGNPEQHVIIAAGS